MKKVAFLLALLASPALAQQAPPPPANVQALSDEIMRLLQAKIEAASMLIDVQRKLAAAEARVKELEANKSDAPMTATGPTK